MAHTTGCRWQQFLEQKVGWHDGCGLGVLYDLAPRAVRTEKWSYHDDRFTGFDWKPFKHKRCSLERELSFSPVLTHELPFNFSQPSRMLQATACSSRLLECWRDVHSRFGNVTHVDLSGGAVVPSSGLSLHQRMFLRIPTFRWWIFRHHPKSTGFSFAIPCQGFSSNS